ncbi:hypothetical protein CEXT_240651 [Caerostris extrusa]|uniref:Uncharacterized protein n=1 Tax=Caerostris extrusa TaxID=172846 RepID=A0AAV4P8X9_CAEEX|nr:hypothetical protein CEXT_240651 [Caerostris extrusa]
MFPGFISTSEEGGGAARNVLRGPLHKEPFFPFFAIVPVLEVEYNPLLNLQPQHSFRREKKSCSVQNIFQVSFQPPGKEKGRSNVLRGPPLQEELFSPPSLLPCTLLAFQQLLRLNAGISGRWLQSAE